MDKRLSRRIDKIERKLRPEKGEFWQFPHPDGSFIDVPGYLTLIDIVAMCGGVGENKELNETGRNRTL